MENRCGSTEPFVKREKVFHVFTRDFYTPFMKMGGREAGIRFKVRGIRSHPHACATETPHRFSRFVA